MPTPDTPPPEPQSEQRAGRRRPGPSPTGRQRPETSALAPAPGPLMSVPDPARGTASAGTRAGRRQHHRTAGSQAGAASEELVYLSGRVPRALRDELHIRAIGEGRPVVDLLRDAIRGYLDHAAPTTQRP